MIGRVARKILPCVYSSAKVVSTGVGYSGDTLTLLICSGCQSKFVVLLHKSFHLFDQLIVGLGYYDQVLMLWLKC